MSRRRHLAAYVIAASALLILPDLAAGATPPDPMLKKINAHRQARGVPALRSSPALARSSRQFAQRQMRRNRFGHDARIQASGKFRSLGEILAFNRGWKIRRGPVVRTWLRSPPHRSVMLSRRFGWVGIGRARGKFGGGYATIWVVQFGRD